MDLQVLSYHVCEPRVLRQLSVCFKPVRKILSCVSRRLPDSKYSRNEALALPSLTVSGSSLTKNVVVPRSALNRTKMGVAENRGP